MIVASVSAFADDPTYTITVNDNHTYRVFQVLTGTLSDANSKKLGNPEWGADAADDTVDAEKETLDFVIDTNLKGAMNCTQAVLRPMIERRYGRIINISSIAAICGLYDRVDYAAAKAALIGMAKALAMEVGEFGITVNCVSPGAIERDGHRMKHMTFLGEEGLGGTPKDIAETVLFLASQEYITGQNFVVDGGRTLGPGWR